MINTFFKVFTGLLIFISVSLLGFLAWTDHAYNFYLLNHEIPPFLAGISIGIFLLLSTSLLFVSDQWKMNNRWLMAGISFMLIPFQWVGIQLYLIEQKMKEEFNYRFGLFRIVRLWNEEEKFEHASSFVAARQYSLPEEVIKEIATHYNSFTAIDQAIEEYAFTHTDQINKNTGIIQWITDHPYLSISIALGTIIVIAGTTYMGTKFFTTTTSSTTVESVAITSKTPEELLTLIEEQSKQIIELQEEMNASKRFMGPYITELKRYFSDEEKRMKTLALLKKELDQTKESIETLLKQSSAQINNNNAAPSLLEFATKEDIETLNNKYEFLKAMAGNMNKVLKEKVPGIGPLTSTAVDISVIEKMNKDIGSLLATQKVQSLLSSTTASNVAKLNLLRKELLARDALWSHIFMNILKPLLFSIDPTSAEGLADFPMVEEISLENNFELTENQRELLFVGLQDAWNKLREFAATALGKDLPPTPDLP